MVIDREGLVVYANTFATDLGLLREDWQGKHYYEVIKSLSAISAVSDAINEKSSKSQELSFGDRELLVKVFYTDEGLLLRISDITPLRRYERSKKEFVVNVSHELKTPITVLKATLETIREEELNPHVRRLVEKALSRVEEMSQLINDLLIIAKLESGEESLNKESLNLKELVDALLKDWEELAQKRRVGLINEVEKTAKVYADREKLTILLKNLIDNAVKYNKESGKAGVRYRSENGWDVVEVWDTGVGIAKEHLPFIFDRFYRADRSRSKDVPGTGLGLSIVKHIALSHGGKVEVESKEGQGSVFRVFLPRQF